MITTTALPKLSAILILLSLLLIAAYPVFAEDATSTGASRKDRVQQKLEIRKEKVAERMENRKEVMATREAALKAKLEKFKDKRKAEVTDRVNTNLNRINQKQTEQMLKHLERMSSILSKLETRVNSGSSDVKDVSSAKEAITEAKAVVEEARALVSAQAEKDYTITVSSEGTVKKDAQKMREQLHNDLKAVKEQVINAKQAVGSAIRIAKSGPSTSSGLERKEGTPSGRE